MKTFNVHDELDRILKYSSLTDLALFTAVLRRAKKEYKVLIEKEKLEKYLLFDEACHVFDLNTEKFLRVASK